jgi:4-amino-4-deoxy-L-arabinose transferase-like glycosyltransferase
LEGRAGTAADAREAPARAALAKGWLAASLLVLVGVGMRVHNALHYPPLWGFDAPYNWRYVERLLRSWSLPAPDADWATAHPPLFYYLAAALVRALGSPGPALAIPAVRLASSAVGLAAIALAALLVRRLDPERPRRALLAAGLLLFLPAHVTMSATLGEEVLASSLASLTVVATVEWLRRRPRPHELRVAAGVGLAAGLAWLTKLTGALLLPVVAGAVALDGWIRGEVRRALTRVGVFLLVALLAGGWYFALNRIRYGYFYPHGLEAHRIMFTMPPGERRVADYLRFPAATFTDPQLLHPDLLRSVWGSTYATLWFDGHRHFLPTGDPVVRRWGTALLLLALVPTAAFLAGTARALRRALRFADSVELPLLGLVASTLAGYVLFTWQNPWFAALKGSYLLGLSVPFAVYASEELERWARRGGVVGSCVWLVLASLAVLVAGAFTYGLVFQRTELPGLVWGAPDAGP